MGLVTAKNTRRAPVHATVRVVMNKQGKTGPHCRGPYMPFGTCHEKTMLRGRMRYEAGGVYIRPVSHPKASEREEEEEKNVLF